MLPRVAGLLLVVVLASGLACAQQSQEQELIVPYWTIEPGWNTEFEVRNNRRDRAVSVTTSLRLASGREVRLAAVSIEPGESKPISLALSATTIAGANVEGSPMFGSAILRFEGNHTANVFSAAIVRRVGRPIAFHFDALPRELTSLRGTRETVWILPTLTATTYVVATNVSATQAVLTFVVSSADGRSAVVKKETAPSQSVRISVREVLGELGTNAAGSVSVSTSGSRPDFIVSAYAFDEAVGFSAISKVFERDPAEQVEEITLRAPMLALRHPAVSLNFPAGTELKPRILIKNASSNTIAPEIVVRWSGAQGSGVSAIPNKALAPGELVALSVLDEAKPQIPAEATWAGVTLRYTGRHGDIVPIAASYDESGHYGTQTPFSAAVAAAWEGGMWHAGGPNENTVITVGNGGNEDAIALLTLNFARGKEKYEIEQQLGPGEQMWVDIGERIRNQVPDRNGKLLPPDISHGTYSIQDLKQRVGATCLKAS
jgi:hypothetical protein